MGFYTGLVYYRPAAPPIVSCTDLAAWIASVAATGSLRGEDGVSLQVKFGDAVDKDDEEDIFSMDCEIDSREFQSVESMSQLLAKRSERIYRAYVSLGMLRDEVLQPITRKASPENEINFCPCDLSLWIGPVQCSALGGDGPIGVGWLSLGISGYGYLYPWTFAEVVQRLEGSTAIQCLMQTCRKQWPIAPDNPSPGVIANRTEIGTLWPYELNKPSDWYWGLQESG